MRRYASRSSSSGFSNHSGGSGENDSGSGSDTAHRRHEVSLPNGSSVSGTRGAIPDLSSNWAPEEFLQGLSVETEENETNAVDQIGFPMDWSFDEPWPS